ncbi:MAG: hypothetical protein RSC31_06025 [Anaerovoracaceae bacterium]
MMKKRVLIITGIAIFFIIAYILWEVDENKKAELEEYNNHAKITKECFDEFYDNILKIQSDNPTSFRDINGSYMSLFSSLDKWSHQFYLFASNNNLPYNENEDILTDPATLVNTSIEIERIYYDIVDVYYLKEPTGTAEFTQEQLSKIVKNLRSKTDTICKQFEL